MLVQLGQILSAKAFSERLQRWVGCVCGLGSSCALEKGNFREVFGWWSHSVHGMNVTSSSHSEVEVCWETDAGEKEGKDEKQEHIFLQGWTNACSKSRWGGYLCRVLHFRMCCAEMVWIWSLLHFYVRVLFAQHTEYSVYPAATASDSSGERTLKAALPALIPGKTAVIANT